MWPNPQETADLVTSTEQILYGTLYFLCIDSMSRSSHLNYQYGAIYVILINNQIIQIINKVLSMKKPNKCNAET